MLYLIILLFIQAITALHTPHSKSESPLLPDASRTIVGARLDLNQTLTPSLNFFQENENIAKVNIVNGNGKYSTSDPKEVDSEEGLIDVSMVARAHPWNIHRARRDEDTQESQERRHTQSKKADFEGGLIDLSMVARAHPWNIDRAHRDEDKQESKKEQRSKSRRRTG
ncbi:hypothetical protein MJO28_012119 [Puccinia striiformis f. sp. tritici]|uniref:Uncharacterized protein n=3 Tax=Puccinia striiformis TaxID=27350 RepID=A0A0L0V9B6_9BASI|nr:hypothetical protein MJO28_012119 [Puccinia striiformis f. sp. tritici]KAI7945924.1 hypothetical protein MJO29_012312 [Puccinia striiformis f. sp. tritici]KAI9606125.1 hypothetical protein H4Q26_004499 [Puccinia striiformis f. sp. tritici PST-130]KNE95791.1 hypothetical protein PSTG_10852 [Puccinia striiformis f. sp. tritici PST-78]POW01217.1 hypothetical protein PSTT_12628 [Puccinia striiformis]